MYQNLAINAQKYWELDYYSCSTWDSLVASAREFGIFQEVFVCKLKELLTKNKFE